jgi:hypothetical protein
MKIYPLSFLFNSALLSEQSRDNDLANVNIVQYRHTVQCLLTRAVKKVGGRLSINHTVGAKLRVYYRNLGHT